MHTQIHTLLQLLRELGNMLCLADMLDEVLAGAATVDSNLSHTIAAVDGVVCV